MAGAVQIPFVVEHLIAHASERASVLDVGCGAAQYRDVTPGYVGLDVTDEPYREGIPRDVDVVASACEMPFENGEFDLAFSVAAFFQIPCWPDALAEIRRVLRPGGRVILFDYNRRAQRRLERLYGRELPCWTQLGLRRRLSRAGFVDCRLLPPTERPVSGLARLRMLAYEELRGQWAIVTGLAPR